MKRFKFWIVSVYVLLSFIISFGYCDLLGGYGETNLSVEGTETVNVPDGQFYCVRTTQYGCTMSPGQPNGDNIVYAYALYCFDGTFEITCPGNTIGVFEGYVYPKMSSIDCQTEYNLIPIESLDTNYCVENQLCPVETGNVASWSELIINDIVHQSAPLINITIPQEYSWDYSVDENEFTLDISGYNVDTEYIDGIIRTQKTTPNSTDFNNIVSGLIPLLVPGLVIILFIYFIFRFIKKVF